MGLFRKKESDSTFKFARLSIKKTNKKIDREMSKIYAGFTNEEKKVIDTFIEKARPYCKKLKIRFDIRNHDINVMVDRMQIGRLAFNDHKRHMQVLTSDINEVNWYEDITLEEALKYVDDWIIYLRYLLRQR